MWDLKSGLLHWIVHFRHTGEKVAFFVLIWSCLRIEVPKHKNFQLTSSASVRAMIPPCLFIVSAEIVVLTRTRKWPGPARILCYGLWNWRSGVGISLSLILDQVQGKGLIVYPLFVFIPISYLWNWVSLSGEGGGGGNMKQLWQISSYL